MNAYLPIHLAVHYLGCALHTSQGVRLPSALHGPYIEGLADSVDKLTVLAYEPPEHPALGEFVDYLARPRRPNISVLSLGPKGTLRNIAARRRRVKEVVGEASPEWDALLFRLPNRRAIDVLAANRCPRVIAFTVGHTPSVVMSAPARPLVKARAVMQALAAEVGCRKVIRESGLPLGNSQMLLDRYRRVAPDMRLVPISIRRQKHSFLPDDRLGGKVDLLVTGRITTSKGVLEAVEVLASLTRAGRDATLHVVGTGDYLEGMRDYAKHLHVDHRIVFHGWVSAQEGLFDIYKQMDVLLLMSRADSMPNAVWEALAHGVIVICTPVGDLGRLFTEEKEVLHVPIGDSDAAARAVQRLIEDVELRRRLIRNGYQRAKDSTVEHVVRVFLQSVRGRWPELGTSPASRPVLRSP